MGFVSFKIKVSSQEMNSSRGNQKKLVGSLNRSKLKGNQQGFGGCHGLTGNSHQFYGFSTLRKGNGEAGEVKN